MYFIHLYRLMQCRSLLLYHFKSCNRYISYEFIGPELCVNLALQCRPRPFSIRSDGLPSHTHTHNGHCTVTLWASLPSMCMPETHGHYRYSLVSSLHIMLFTCRKARSCIQWIMFWAVTGTSITATPQDGHPLWGPPVPAGVDRRKEWRRARAESRSAESAEASPLIVNSINVHSIDCHNVIMS